MQDYFEGWYLKAQSDSQTLAVIPAIHRNRGRHACSIQIITEDNAWTILFPYDVFRRAKRGIAIGKNIFGKQGVRLFVNEPDLSIKGRLKFGTLTPLKYNIMGPFALVPFMECRHSVFSMQHTVKGTVVVNGKRYVFDNAIGYWEGDRGRSFPKEYLWTQCIFPEGSIMLSVADIPLAGMHFTGIIGVVLWQGREYRIATYLGAKVVRIQNGSVRIIQGDMELEARLLESSGKALKAPTDGKMVRIIHESVTCRAYYRFCQKSGTLFEFETEKASFEYEYSR